MGNNMTYTLPFLEINKHTFDLIRDNKKKIETRAGNSEYLKIIAGDVIEFSCGDEVFMKQVKKVTHFRSLDDMLKVYKFYEINLEYSSNEEAKSKYLSFPGYESRLKEFGIIVFEL